jgi:protein-tyrosine phosphatase
VSDRDVTSFVDIHNHLVPGVDDGARDVPAVLDSVERFTRLSVRRIVTTPHIEGSLTHDAVRLEERLGSVTEAWKRAEAAIRESFPEVEFHRGHEVLLDVPQVDFSDPRIRLAGTRFVLVEWPRLQLPPGTVRVLAGIRDQGWRPIVAHPERYAGMGQAIGIAAQWREVGAHLQVNFGSLVARYGSSAQSTAYRLLRRGWVDYLASDFHGHPRLKLHVDEASEVIEGLGADEVLTYLYRTNPSRLLADQDPLPPPILPSERGMWARLQGMIERGTS